MQTDLMICTRDIMQKQVRFEERNTHISPDILGEEKDERLVGCPLLTLPKGGRVVGAGNEMMKANLDVDSLWNAHI